MISAMAAVNAKLKKRGNSVLGNRPDDSALSGVKIEQETSLPSSSQFAGEIEL